MKKIILLSLLLKSFYGSASSFAEIYCGESVFCGATNIEVNANNQTYIITQDHPRCLGEPKEISAGYFKIFYESDTIAILDLFEKGDQKGSLIAIQEPTRKNSRLTYNNQVLSPFNFNCTIIKVDQ